MLKISLGWRLIFGPCSDRRLAGRAFFASAAGEDARRGPAPARGPETVSYFGMIYIPVWVSYNPIINMYAFANGKGACPLAPQGTLRGRLRLKALPAPENRVRIL